jgi:uncharacterized protein involved in outer membrane biogenesis
MARWRTPLLIAAGVIAFLAIAAALALHAFVDPDRLKEAAREKAWAAWSRELAIGGVELDLWPVPTLHAQNVALSNAPWASAPSLLHARHIRARLALLPLLKGDIRLKALHLEGVQASLEKAADGSRNWNLQAGNGASSPGPALLELESVRIADAEIRDVEADGAAVTWQVDDARIDANPGLRDVRLEARLARNGAPLRVQAQVADAARFGEPGAISDGKLDASWGDTRLAVAGRLPLEKSLAGLDLTAELQGPTLDPLLAFFGIARGATAPVAVRLVAREAQGSVQISSLDAALGGTRVTGDARWSTKEGKPVIDARLASDAFDWSRVMLDAGGEPVPPPPPGKVFHDRPLGWPALALLKGKEGTIDIAARRLVLRNGVELANVKAQGRFDGDRLELRRFSTELLGGSAQGSLLLEGARKGVKMDFDGSGLLLERWFRERGSRIPLRAGPMQIKAALHASGDSMKELAASLTGPVTIRMGPAVWASGKAGETEALMTQAFAAQDAPEIRFECVAAMLPFKAGRATQEPIVGFRTAASDLLTSGTVDFREQVLDLRGRVKAKSGVTLGLAAVAGEVQITGPIRHPRMTLDPGGTPKALARVGAAIATAGASLLGAALVDAARAGRDDACEAVLRAKRR